MGLRLRNENVQWATRHIGDRSYRTHRLHFFPFWGGSDAVEGVFGDGRETAVCGSPASRRGDGGTLQRVWDFSQDRLQDLRSLPGMWSSRADRQKPSSLSVCPSTSLSGGELYPEYEARAHHLGSS